MNSVDLPDRWDYWTETYDLTRAHDGGFPSGFAQALNALGTAGWELVSANLQEREYERKLLCIFKRRCAE